MKLKNKGLTLIVLSSFLLLAILSIVATAEAAGYDYTLPDVMKGKAGDLSAQVRGAGGHTGKCIQVTIHNSAGVTKRVKVPIGTRLEPKNKGVQPMYTAGGEVLRAGPGTSSHSINAFCGDRNKRSPGTRDVFSFGGYAGSDLMSILGAINDQGAYNCDGQDAVWHNTNDLDIFNNARAQAIIDGIGPSAGAAAAAAAATCVLAAVWGILNGLANIGISPINSSGGGGTAGGTSISPLIDPDTGEQLTVHDGNYESGKTGQVWYDGQWADKGTAAQWIAERRDELTQRQHERESFWSDAERDREQRIKDRADRLRDEGYVYDPAQEAWVQGQDLPSVIEQQRLQEAQQLNDFIERNVDDLARTDFLQDLVDRVRMNGGDMDRLRNAIKDSTVGAEQQLSMGASEAALAEADAWRESEEYAAGVRDWSQRTNRVIGRYVPGAGPLINAIQNGVYGTVQGYEQGGWHGAFTAAAAQIVDEFVENYTYVPGTGTAFRDACGTGYEKDKDGNWTSPIDRFTDSLWHGVADQYDPTKYIDRWQKADGFGDYFDIGIDAVDAIGDVHDLGQMVYGAYERTPKLPTSEELNGMNTYINKIDVNKEGLRFVDPRTEKPRQHLWGDPEHCRDFLNVMGEHQKFEEISMLPKESQHKAYNEFIRDKVTESLNKSDTFMYENDYHKFDGSFEAHQVNVEFASPKSERILVTFDDNKGQIFNTFDIKPSGTPIGGGKEIPHPTKTFRNREWIKGNDKQWLTSRGELDPTQTTKQSTRTSISTRIHWQDFKENENNFAEMAKDFMRRRNK